VNPDTGRKIKVGGPTYKKWEKKCSRSRSVSRSRSPSKSQSVSRSRLPSRTRSSGSKCSKWLANRKVNPDTGRKIKVGGPTYKKWEKRCKSVGDEVVHAKTTKKPSRSTKPRKPKKPTKAQLRAQQREKEKRAQREEEAKQARRDERERKGYFVADKVEFFRQFTCENATNENCGLKANKFVPFSLQFLDKIWKETHDGNLPGEADVREFRLWRFENEASVSRRQSRQPDMSRLKRYYVPNLDRRQFYCWMLSSKPEAGFCRDVKVAALKIGGLSHKEKRTCAKDCDEVWKDLGIRRYSNWVKILSAMYRSVGGSLPQHQLTSSNERAAVRYLCGELKKAHLPNSTADQRAFCKLFTQRVKPAIRFPDLSLPPLDFRRAIDRQFKRYGYTTPTMKNGCVFVKDKMLVLANQQKFVKAYLTPAHPVKGLLLNHAAGTGKTCAAVSVLSSFISFESQNHDDEPWQVIWVTRPALTGEPLKAMFEDTCLGPLRQAIKDEDDDFQGTRGYGPKLSFAKDRANWPYLRRRFAKGFGSDHIVKYSSLANMLGTGTQLGHKILRRGVDPLRKTLLVFDEAHNIFNQVDLPPGEAMYMNRKMTGRFGRNLEGREHIVNAIHNSYAVSGNDSVRVLLATATPMTASPIDAFRLINLLIPKVSDRLPNTMEDLRSWTDEGGRPFLGPDGRVTETGVGMFMDRTKGTISYFSGDKDPRYFAMKRWGGVIEVPVTGVQEKYMNKCLGWKEDGKPKGKKGGKSKKSKGSKSKDTYKAATWTWKVSNSRSRSPSRSKSNSRSRSPSRSKSNSRHSRSKHSDSRHRVSASRSRARVLKAMSSRGRTSSPRVKANKDLEGKALEKAQGCLRNVANMAAMRGKLLPTNEEMAKAKADHDKKEDEREAKAAEKHAAKWGKKMDAYDKKAEKWSAWEHWDRLCAASPPVKPKKPKMPRKPRITKKMTPREVEQLLEGYGREKRALEEHFEAEKEAYAHYMALKPKGGRPRGPKPEEPEVPSFLSIHKRKPMPKLKDGPSFSFTFDGTRWTPQLLAKAMGTYGPKLKALLEKIEELDRKDMETHGKVFKHSIYTDTAKGGYGSKIVGAAFIASGYARACHFVNRETTDAEGHRKRVTVLEPPTPQMRKCKGQVPFTPGTFDDRKTFALLSSTAVDGHPKDDRRRDATVALFNDKGNVNGEKVRFILLDSGFKEGISLSDVRYAHLLEPPLSQSSLKQAVARSARRCKSTQLKLYDIPPKGWLVDVFVYREVFGKGTSTRKKKTVHDLVMELLGERAADMRMMDEFENLLMMSAVDHNLNKAILDYKPEGVVDAIAKGKAVLNLA